MGTLLWDKKFGWKGNTQVRHRENFVAGWKKSKTPRQRSATGSVPTWWSSPRSAFHHEEMWPPFEHGPANDVFCQAEEPPGNQDIPNVKTGNWKRLRAKHSLHVFNYQLISLKAFECKFRNKPDIYEIRSLSYQWIETAGCSLTRSFSAQWVELHWKELHVHGTLVEHRKKNDQPITSEHNDVQFRTGETGSNRSCST